MRTFLIFVIVPLFLASCVNVTAIGAGQEAYGHISVEDLQQLNASGEDYTFINVHIPLDGNIPDTDLVIPFDQVKDHQHLLPQDKDQKIVIYCRSGPMGDTASQALVDLGYTDVSNLEGGYIAWQAAGLPFDH